MVKNNKNNFSRNSEKSYDFLSPNLKFFYKIDLVEIRFDSRRGEITCLGDTNSYISL